MRIFFLSLMATGFLALIALSWKQTSETESPRKTHPADRPLASVMERFPSRTESDSLNKIRALERCYRGSCVDTSSGTDSEKSAIGENLAIALAEHLSNFGPNPELARSGLLSQEPIVQAVALKMLGELQIGPETLSALGNGLRGTTDPAIVEGAVKELQRYLGSTAEVEAQKILEFFVSNDSQSCAERAAALARPFINIHSHRDFQNLLARLDPQKQVAKFLKSALADYEQHASLR